ncbi:MAG: epoxide hydrolase family protein [Spongiibacteraceae bacterium]
MKFSPFKIDIDQGKLDDLQARLEKTRLTDDYGDNTDWAYGSNGQYMAELIEYWRDSYNWRDHEAAMNKYPHYRCEIRGIPIHFIHIKGKGPSPTPLLLSHGWPWTFWDYQKVIGPLSDPASFGGNSEDAFDLIIPSLPGYGFSTPLKTSGVNYWETADIFVELMQGLGYERFAAHGHDWGAIITAQLGHKHADKLIGCHFTTMLPLDTFTGGTVDPDFFTEEEQHLATKNELFFSDGGGYFAIQTTRPQTLSYGLNDSPAGLLAWILEKRRDWSDCKGNIETRFSKDDIITTVMLYWLTESIGSSTRFYYEAAHNPWQPSHDQLPVVQAPSGLALFPEEVLQQPKAWIKHYYNAVQITDMPQGGHFAAMEEPERLTADIQSFFSGLKSQ